MSMSPEQSFPIAIGAVIAAGSTAVQASGPSEWSVIVPLVSAVIGAVFSYAVLKTTVSKIEKDLHLMRQDLGQMYDVIRELSNKVARIEGRLEER